MSVRKSKSTHSPLSDDALDLVANRFRVLGEANRLRLVQALYDGERCVTDLTKATGLNQANASRHLQTLTDAGVLRRRKDGLRVLYSIADPGIFTLCDHVCGSLQQRVELHAKVFRQ